MSATRKTGGVLALCMAVGMLLSLMVVPASAADPVVGVSLFRGRAKIGDTYPAGKTSQADARTCGQGTPGTKSGLHLPVGTGGAAGKDLCYVFAAPGGVPDIHHSGPPKPAAAPFCIAAGVGLTGGVPGGVVVNTCSIVAHGRVGPTNYPTPLDGAYCGISRGRDGNGMFTVDPPGPGLGGPLALKLYNVRWHPSSAGSILPVQAHWWNTATAAKKGELVALVQASGTTNGGAALLAACATPNGATSFDVNAIAVLY